MSFHTYRFFSDEHLSFRRTEVNNHLEELKTMAYYLSMEHAYRKKGPRKYFNEDVMKELFLFMFPSRCHCGLDIRDFPGKDVHDAFSISNKRGCGKDKSFLVPVDDDNHSDFRLFRTNHCVDSDDRF